VQRVHSPGNSFTPLFLSHLDKPISYKGYRAATAAARSLQRIDSPREKCGEGFSQEKVLACVP